MNSALDSCRYASVNRDADWKWCCMEVLGWRHRHEAHVTHSNETAVPRINGKSRTDVVLVNLVDDGRKGSGVLSSNIPSEEQRLVVDPDDFWREAIQEMEDNLNRMINWLGEKSWTYLLPQTSDEEASLIQSTVSSYTVTSANELENLRRHYQSMITSTENTTSKKSHQHQQNDMVVIQILSERLKERVAEPFSKLQKQRKRDAVKIWQNPLSSRFVPSLQTVTAGGDNDAIDLVLGLESSRDRKFVPKQPRHAMKHEQNFLDSYSNVPINPPPERPQTFFADRLKRKTESTSVIGDYHTSSLIHSQNPQSKRSKPSMKQKEEEEDIFHQSVDVDQLQQEAVLLQAQHQQHDLDAVHNMETTMVQITSLLSQFSELVSCQQEEVLQIHDAVTTSKENMEKGKEELVDATRRTQQSKHYMASAITAMGVALLFFHWIQP